MTLQDFISTIAPSFMESGALLTSETRFKELGDWNSLSALMLITTVGQQLGISLEASDLYDADTIADLYNIITSRS